MFNVTNHGGERVEGCESSRGQGRCEGAFARALVWGDVDPHGGGLSARETDGDAIVKEVGASGLFESLEGWIDDAHACEVVRCLTMRQYVKQTEKVSAESPGGRQDCREEEKIALLVVEAQFYHYDSKVKLLNVLGWRRCL